MTQLAEITKPLPAALLESIDPGMLDDSASRAWLVQYLHGDAVTCPECGQEIESERQRESFRAGRRLCCKACGRWFDQRTGTAIAATTLDHRQILLLGLLLGIGQTPRQISGQLRLNESTIRDWRDRLSLPGLRFTASTAQG